MRGVLKSNLPHKQCPVCLRSFSWRKRWAKTWDDVKYCSDACRHGKGKQQPIPKKPGNPHAP